MSLAIRCTVRTSNIFVSPVSRMARICFLTVSLIAAHHLAGVLTVSHGQAAAVVPCHHDRADVVHAAHGAFGANWWCLRVVHSDKLHTAPNRVTLAEALYQLLTWKPHRQTPPCPAGSSRHHRDRRLH